MKRFLILAAVVGGLTLTGFASTAKADGWRGGYGRWHGYGYGWRGGYRPYYGYGYRPYVAPGVVIGGPRFRIGVGVAPAYAYPPRAYYGPGYGYPGYYGW